MKTIFACAAAAATLLISSGASAQEASISTNIGVVSDYVFRGFSQSNEEAALQGGVDLDIGNGFYAGVWASTIDFGDSTDVEVDLYGGYRGEVAGFSYDVGVIGYNYIDAPTGSEYNLVEYKVAASHSVGAGSLGAAVYYSPDFFGGIGEAIYYEANGSYPVTDAISVSGAYGYQDFEIASGYSTWNLGVSWAFYGPLALDVRYHDSDESTPLSDGRVVGGLKVVF